MSRPPRVQPRISANELALYMVSSDTARMGIIRRAAEPPPFLVTRYQDVRSSIKTYLSDIARRRNPLDEAEAMFQQRIADPSQSDVRQDDARQSIEVISALEAMNNQLAGYNFSSADHSQPKLMISGVEVSVRVDLWVHGQQRGVEQIGGAILRMTQDQGARRDDMGRYVATLVRMHLDQSNPSDRTPTNRLCMAIDVRHGEIFPAPNANARRVNDIQAACRVIHALWGQA